MLTVDAHATVIEAGLKGYDKWRTSRSRTAKEVGYLGGVGHELQILTMSQKQQAASVEEYFEKWCGDLLEMTFEVKPYRSALSSSCLLRPRTPSSASESFSFS